VTRPTTSPCTRAARSRGSADAAAFYTVGHSTRSVDTLVALLREANVTVVADVRTMPRSRANPQYNSDSLSRELAARHIEYEHVPELGGLRARQQAVPPDVNGFWKHTSFHNYADYAISKGFHCGLEHLRELAHGRSCAIMCAETLWWRCHRRIIADYLLAAHETVFHIIGPGQIVPAVMTKAARFGGQELLVYPAEAEQKA
jgi:uncharacterized protein (DUF488 family)